MKSESLLLPPILLVSVYHPCHAEADRKEEELEAGPGGFSLDGLQQGLGLAQGSDLDKLGDRQCHRPTNPHLTSACSLPALVLSASHPELSAPGSWLWRPLSGGESGKPTITT